MSSRISVRRAIWTGLLWVNVPVLVWMASPLFVVSSVMSPPGYWGLAAFLLGFIAAWLWWSVAVARWRLWAYERVTDIETLRAEAVAVGLTWPTGHLFERTELKSQEMRSQQAAFEEGLNNVMQATRETRAPDD